ncbi:hypothetical protein V8E53_011686 [Lactarius tabidus]
MLPSYPGILTACKIEWPVGIDPTPRLVWCLGLAAGCLESDAGIKEGLQHVNTYTMMTLNAAQFPTLARTNGDRVTRSSYERSVDGIQQVPRGTIKEFRGVVRQGLRPEIKNIKIRRQNRNKVKTSWYEVERP